MIQDDIGIYKMMKDNTICYRSSSPWLLHQNLFNCIRSNVDPRGLEPLTSSM